MKSIAWLQALLVVMLFFTPASAQEILQNGDFETIAVSGDPPMPTRDAFGNATPINGFGPQGRIQIAPRCRSPNSLVRRIVIPPMTRMERDNTPRP